MTESKRGFQKSRQAYIPAPGDGVHFKWSKPNAKESKRIDLIVRVDRALIQRDRGALAKLQKECAGIPILAKKIQKALKG